MTYANVLFRVWDRRGTSSGEIDCDMFRVSGQGCKLQGLELVLIIFRRKSVAYVDACLHISKSRKPL